MAWKVGHPLQRDGVSQRQRLLEALVPENVPIDGRQQEDLLLFLYKLAGELTFYNLENRLDYDEVDLQDQYGVKEAQRLAKRKNSWEEFFPDFRNDHDEYSISKVKSYLEAVFQRKDNSVFMTILLVFLQQFGEQQKEMNKLTGKHLEYYFNQVLGFKRLPGRPDEVHVLFEPSPNIDQVKIPVGTALKAGKDALGKPLTYVTNREIVVNQATVGQLKTVLVRPNGQIYVAEVANSLDGLGAPLDENLPHWAPFGDPEFMQPGTVGMAIASPIFLLKEGKREIVLDFILPSSRSRFKDEDFNGFQFHGSGENEWIELSGKVNFISRRRGFRRRNDSVEITLSLDPGQKAIVGFNPDALPGPFNTTFPIIKIQLDPYRSAYSRLKGLKLQSLNIKVKVGGDETEYSPGIQNLILQNDFGVLDPAGIIQPFGPEPKIGSQFLIGSQEILSKPIDALNLSFLWSELPIEGTFRKHYEGYGGSFTPPKTIFSVLDGGTWSQQTDFQFFDAISNQRYQKDIPDTFQLAGFSLEDNFEVLDSSLNRGFIRFQLQGDFWHNRYSKAFGTALKDNNIPVPNTPFTPTIRSVSLGYTASQNIELGQTDPHFQLFHLEPFGNRELKVNTTPYLLPSLPSGTLYIGLEDFHPPQNIHLLFQVAEGSALSDKVVSNDQIEWNYLTEKGWRQEGNGKEDPLSGSEIFINTTEGLQQSGMVALSIGKDATNLSSQLPMGYHWLRVSLKENGTAEPAGAARLIDVKTQVITAVFQDQDNDPNHLNEPLSAEKIKGLKISNSAIRKIRQPYSSFNGFPKEQTLPYYTRVSERLRHKNRSSTLWDLERLVLQEFPEVYKIKTIPHTGLDKDSQYSEFEPGQVTAVVIPQLRNKNAINPLEPSLSVAVLERIKDFITPLASPFLKGRPNKLHIINPRYEPIFLSMSIGFRAGYDPGFYVEVLNQALIRHLSPWAFEEGADIQFGGKVYKSQLLAFVEEQEYVDYVTDFAMFSLNAGPGIGEMCIDIDFIVREKGQSLEEGIEVAEASTAASIIVSAKVHRIDILKPGEYPCNDPVLCGEGIGCWKIDIDFEVGVK